MSRITCLLLSVVAISCLGESLGEGKDGDIPGQDCPMVGLDCLFHDIRRAADAGSWQECGVQCAQDRLCAYWSWRLPSANINPYGCWLKSGCPFTLPDTNLISGQYSCTS